MVRHALESNRLLYLKSRSSELFFVIIQSSLGLTAEGGSNVAHHPWFHHGRLRDRDSSSRFGLQFWWWRYYSTINMYCPTSVGERCLHNSSTASSRNAFGCCVCVCDAGVSEAVDCDFGSSFLERWKCHDRLHGERQSCCVRYGAINARSLHRLRYGVFGQEHSHQE